MPKSKQGKHKSLFTEVDYKILNYLQTCPNCSYDGCISLCKKIGISHLHVKNRLKILSENYFFIDILSLDKNKQRISIKDDEKTKDELTIILNRLKPK